MDMCLTLCIYFSIATYTTSSLYYMYVHVPERGETGPQVIA